MEKKLNYLLISFFFSICIFSYGGNDSTEFQLKNQLRATSSFAMGYFPTWKNNHISILGNIEYYLSNKTSIRGEGFYSLGAAAAKKDFASFNNHNLASGALYHFLSGKQFDPYLGIMPGISIFKLEQNILTSNSSSNVLVSIPESEKLSVAPVFLIPIGFNYYFEKWFHLFADISWIYGNQFRYPDNISMHELRFSFGLGFNVALLKN